MPKNKDNGLSKKSAKKAVKKPAPKVKSKKTPDIFGTDMVLTTWDDPISANKTSFRHLDAVALRYICTSLKHLTAEVELLSEVKKANDPEYEVVIDEHLANSLDNLIVYLKDFTVLKD